MEKKRVLDELKIIEKKEEQILRDIEDKKKELLQIRRLVKKFDFSDFAQCVVGAGVFGLPAMFTPDFWEFLSAIPTGKVLFMHLFFFTCVFMTLNYNFRDNFSFDTRFLGSLSKRVFYMYTTVFVTMIVLNWTFGKIGPDYLTIDFIRVFLATQSVGLVGAATFQLVAD